MKGLELSRRFYEECGRPILEEQFSHLLPYLAVGLAGGGSECLGYDDDLSRDHDFEPGFCIFLPNEETVSRKDAFALERAYAKLPREFKGYHRSPLSPVGGNRHGVLRTEEFLQEKTGTPNGTLALRDWFFVPEQSLAEATNGKIFYDGLGHVTKIRNSLSYLPEDVRRKKLAGHLLLMGQAGQYNYSRCLARNETAAAQLAVFEFVKSALHVIFLLNKTYLPYYKWSFRALRFLPCLSNLHKPLEYLICSENTIEERMRKQRTVEWICQEIATVLRTQGLTERTDSTMEAHAYAVNNTVEDGSIRNLHILYAV